MKNPVSKTQRLAKATLYGIVIVVCGLPLFYFVLYRGSDYLICRTLISMRLGLKPSPFTLESYIGDSLTPGMSQAEVETVLERIGKVDRVPMKGGATNILTDQDTIKLCTHPLNKITIFANYSLDNKLISMKIIND